MGRNSIIWPMLEYQQRQQQLAGQGVAGDVLKNYDWGQGGQGPQAPMPGQSSQPSGGYGPGQTGAPSDPNSDNYQEPGRPQPAAYSPSRGPSGPPDWNQAPARLQPQQQTTVAQGGSNLPDMVSHLESDRGRANYRQPPGMADPTYGQFPGFAKQWGQGPEGINNFSQAVLKVNPNATVGDFYASYVLGTGTPGQFKFDDLKARYPAAHANFIKNAGVDPNTPLAGMGKGGGAINTPVVQNMTQTLAPAAPHMTLEGIVKTAKRMNPNISGQELFMAVQNLMPVMNADANEQFKLVRLQMEEMRLEQAQERITDTEKFRQEGLELNREKEQFKEEIDTQKLELQKARLGIYAQKSASAIEQANKKLEIAEKTLNLRERSFQSGFALKQAKEAKDQALRSLQEQITAASNIADPDLRDKFIAEAEAAKKEVEDRYNKLNDAYKKLPFPSAPGGGSVEARKTEPIPGAKPTPVGGGDEAPAVGTTKEYQGKKYRFKGGDWKSKDSWEEVDSGTTTAGQGELVTP